DRGDARKTGWQQAQVGKRHITAEHPQSRVEVGDTGVGEFLGDLPDRPFGGYPQCLVASFLLCACTHDLVGLRIVLEHRDELGDALVGVTHVRVGPHHELTACAPGADTAYGARTPVVPEGDHLHVWIEPLDVSETFQGGVGGGVVHGEQFVPVTGAGHRRADPLDLVDDVL